MLSSHGGGCVERNGDHLGEAELAIFRREHFGTIEMVGHGADAESALAEVGSVGIEAGSFHLDAEDTHLLPLLILPGGSIKSGIKVIGRKQVADMDVDAEIFSGLFCGGEEREIRNGSESSADAEILNITGSGAGTLGEDHIEKGKILKFETASTEDDTFGEIQMLTPFGASWQITSECIMGSSDIYADLDPAVSLPSLMRYYDVSLMGGKSTLLSV